MTAINIYKGDTSVITITVTNEDETAYDLTDYTMTLTVKEEKTDADADAKIQVEATISTPASGVGVISLTPTHTGITPGKYYYDIQINNGTSVVKTIELDTFTILQDVTVTAE